MSPAAPGRSGSPTQARLAFRAALLAAMLTVAYYLLVSRAGEGGAIGCLFAPVVFLLFISVALGIHFVAWLVARCWVKKDLLWRAAACLLVAILVGLPLLLVRSLAPAVACAASLRIGGLDQRPDEGRACLELAVATRSSTALQLIVSTDERPIWALERIATLDWPELTLRQRGVVGLVIGNTDPVLHLVGRDPRLSQASLRILASRMGVGATVARNPSTEASVLEALSLRNQFQIDGALALNLASPPRLLAKLARSPERTIRLHLTLRENLGRATLEALSRDSDWLVRLRVARRPDLPQALREQLANDEDERVRLAAHQGIDRQARQDQGNE